VIVPSAYVALTAVKTGVRASEARFDASEADLLMSVANAFLVAAAADEILVARRSSVGLLEEALQVAQKREAVGAVTTFDVDRAQLVLIQARQQVAEADNDRAKAYRALGTLIGVDGPFAIQPQFSQQPQPGADDVGLALQLRPEYRAAEETFRAAQAQRRARAWEWAPSLSAFGNVRRFNYDNFALDDYSWAVGGQLDWVFFDGGARDARRHAAAAQEVQAEAQIALVREGIRDDLADSAGTLRTKQQGQEAAERSVALARRALGLARVQYETGVGTELDLLQAEDAAVTSMVGLAQAHFDVAAADLALRHAAGTFPPK
jgi:outer membrane protein TolC